MHTNTHARNKQTGRKITALTVWVLLIAMLLQAFSLVGSAAAGRLFSLWDNDLQGTGSGSITHLKNDELTDRLRKDFLKSVNKDLLYKIEDYKLSGKVDAILSFSDSSLVSAYTSSSSQMTLKQYLDSKSASELQADMTRNQEGVLDTLWNKGLITNVKYNYYHVMDGAMVSTTYEQLDELCEVAGVERVMISNTYLPAAVENPVNVYETGIFNSSDVSYTGKGTLVAILDTGCDYTHTAFTTHQVQSPLYDRDDIAALLPYTQAYGFHDNLEAREVYYGNLTGGKIAFGYDYADLDPDIMPFNSNHGTHVAGIIGGKDDTIQGVAIDTQLAIMKVFSDYQQTATDGDLLAALEDSVVLGVDAINMSLGTSCGFTREVDEDYKNSIYDNIEKAGISLIVAASNDYSSGYGSEEGNTNKTSNPDSATVGAPSTYDAAMSVASINGNKDKYMMANGTHTVFFNEAVNQSAKDYDFFQMLGVSADSPLSYPYVTVPGYGLAINYAGLDVTGKIVLVRRGEITFEEKVQYAYEAGATAIIIYNNVGGEIIITVGNNAKIPVASISKDDGDMLAALGSGSLHFDFSNLAGPFMSDFSSWGPTPNLNLKPDITAHGGNILSAIPGGDYEKVSGTSMAAPNMCGIVVLIRQYVKENYTMLTGESNMNVETVRDLVNQLCMSTATIALDHKGNPYSPRKQGAGIADIARATQTPAYLWVEGIGKTKLELGDDPERKGVYTMTVNLKNVSNTALSYRVGSIAMTESLSTSDPEYVAEMGYILSNGAEYSVTGGTFENGIVTVAAGQSAAITVKLTLSAEDKAYLNESFENGMFVEGFLTFDNTAENGIDLNAPFLAFYGDWSEAPIFDLDYYEVETEAHNNAIDDDDKIKADYYATTPLGSYYYDYMVPLGAYMYELDESEYPAIPATEEKAAVSYYADCISGVYGVFCGLLRGAKEMSITVKNTTTGEVVKTYTYYNCHKAHFSGSPYPYMADLDLLMADYDSSEVFGYNNNRFEVTMSAKLDWDGNRNSSDTYSFSFYVDYEAPTVTDATFRTEYDKSQKKDRHYVDLFIHDNHYAMSVRPVVVYDDVDKDGKPTKTYASLSEYPIPVYQETRGTTSKVSVEITDYIDLIGETDMSEGITFYIDDYAMNSTVVYIPFPNTENADLEFLSSSIDLDINQTEDLSAYLAPIDSAEKIDTAYLKSLTWASSDPSVVAIHNGKIEALKAGSATISVTGDSWTYTDDKKVEHQIYKYLEVNVSENTVDNPNSAAKIPIEKLEFTSYNTLFAFNSDIDFSEIGKTGSINYFDGNYNISFYPSEQVKLHYNLSPWNISPDRYTLTWSSSNPKVATVDQNGVVTAESEGKARITLQITIDGKTSLLAARCSVEVKSEFIIENRTLVAYKGKGGDVVIPDDEGILTIGKFAFAHYEIDHELKVEKDENGNYDLDEKKTAIGNDTLTSVIIPDGVETIEKYAFYKCSLLRDVILPETCTVIGEEAFAGCEVLENINLDHVQTVSNKTFYECGSLTGDGIGGINMSHISAIGDYAFAKTRLKSIELTNLSRSGIGAFADCTKLESVVLGRRTRVSKSMFENTALKNIVIYSDTVSDFAFRNCAQLVSVQLCNDLTYLGEEAFSGCTSLSSVQFDGVCEEIARLAFHGCSALSSLTLPNCSVKLGGGAFALTGLTSVKFAPDTQISSADMALFDQVRTLSFDVADSNHYKLVNGVLYSKDGSVLVLALPGACVGEFTVPAGVKVIGDSAFSALTGLTSLKFENGSQLERIGFAAFSYCTSLKTVTLPNRAVKIGDLAFYEATALNAVNLTKVTEIGASAFENTALTTVVIPSDNVTIGERAFYRCQKLTTVTLAGGAAIGDLAFASTPVRSVVLNGNGVTVGNSAFYGCAYLSDLDFTKLTGKLGDYAFYMCASLVSVNMPNVVEIGIGCFADCYKLSTFSAANLEVVGDGAFSVVDKTSQHGAIFTTITAPKLRVIGQKAFFGCLNLTEIDLSNVTQVGSNAFTYCQSLKTVLLSDKLTELAAEVFYGCVALTEIDLSNIVRFNSLALYGVPLPAELRLDKAEYVGDQAFFEANTKGYLVSVIAPNVTYIGEQAFAACQKLVSVSAPKLEHIGVGAFYQTAISEFEIAPTLKKIDYSVFGANTVFSAFFATVNGEKVYDAKFDSTMIKDGVLYTIVEEGYVLTYYPQAKTDETFTVVDGTVRVEYRAAASNPYLKKVVLPASMRSIGDYAFSECAHLETVVFRSYYAPVLEGTMSAAIEIKPDNVADYPGFEKLYRYDYYYRVSDLVAAPRYYNNFVGTIGHKDAANITYIIPDNCEGYDSILYTAYFRSCEETSGKTTGKYALAFIEAAKKLPDTVDRFDKKLIDAAINAYNALESHADELATVDSELIQRFNRAHTQYKISVAENKINHLFDMYRNEYSFNQVKDAWSYFQTLTAEEKTAVSNAALLTTKVNDLTAVMGMTPDFSKSFAEHFPTTDAPDSPDAPVDTDEGISTWVIVLIILLSVVVAAGATVTVILVIKKKKAAATDNEDADASASEEKAQPDTAPQQNDQEESSNTMNDNQTNNEGGEQ